ncbi:hypothetical protein HK097_010780 [Rhizophlyctis rosea]|uniref:Uncharacterized protein n=1 Tax=Rhizophlyctis rosea TaxID=64517 RepID=A0AAD5X8R3_9FUNG|nr:hypothetical protein HK097_010780 [Rhizophlyctis rosea]
MAGIPDFKATASADGKAFSSDDYSFNLFYETFFGVTGKVIVMRIHDQGPFIIAAFMSIVLEAAGRIWNAYAFRQRSEKRRKGIVPFDVDWESMPRKKESEKDGNGENPDISDVEKSRMDPRPDNARIGVMASFEMLADLTMEKGFGDGSVSTAAKQPPGTALPSTHATHIAWGTRTIAADQASWISRAGTVIALAVFIVPEQTWWTCDGYITPAELAWRSCLILAAASIVDILVYRWEAEITGVDWTTIPYPRAHWQVYGIAVVMVMSSGVGGILVTEAGLFRENQCLGAEMAAMP